MIPLLAAAVLAATAAPPVDLAQVCRFASAEPIAAMIRDADQAYLGKVVGVIEAHHYNGTFLTTQSGEFYIQPTKRLKGARPPLFPILEKYDWSADDTMETTGDLPVNGATWLVINKDRQRTAFSIDCDWPQSVLPKRDPVVGPNGPNPAASPAAGR